MIACIEPVTLRWIADGSRETPVGWTMGAANVKRPPFSTGAVDQEKWKSACSEALKGEAETGIEPVYRALQALA